MSLTVWLIIGAVIVVTTLAPYVLVLIARRADRARARGGNADG